MKRLVIPIAISTVTCLFGTPAAQAQIILDNFGSADGYSAGFVSQSTGNYLAQTFTSGKTSCNFVDVTVQVSATAPGDIQLAIYNDVAGTPGNNLSGFVSKSLVNGQLVTYSHLLSGIAPSVIAPTTKYWVVLRSSTAASSNFYWFISANGVTPAGTIVPNLGDATVGAGDISAFASFNGGLIWQHPSGFLYGNESFLLRIVGSISGAPTLTSIAPTQGYLGSADTTITINGSNFASNAVVNFGATALATTYVSATQLKAVVPASMEAGLTSYNVTVVNPGTSGGTSNPLTFNIVKPAPKITSLDPKQALVGSPDTTVTVNGTGFVNTSVVKIGTTALATTYVSATQLKAVIPASMMTASANLGINVVNPAGDGGSGAASPFVVGTSLTPVLASVSPTTAIIGSTDKTITLTGTNFVATSSVKLGTTALATTYVSATKLTAVVPASLMTKTGNANLTVVNPAPGGGTSAAVVFGVVNPVPTITSVTPATITENSVATTITVNGTNFVSNSLVKVGTTNLVTTYVSSTKLTAVVPATLLTTIGDKSVTVFNTTPGGGTSNAGKFTVVAGTTAMAIVASPAPTITRSGSTLTVTVTLKNTGSYIARDLAVTGALLNTTATTTVFATTTQTIAVGGTTVVTLTFPGTAATVGTTPKVSVTYTSSNAGKTTLTANTAVAP